MRSTRTSGADEARTWTRPSTPLGRRLARPFRLLTVVVLVAWSLVACRTEGGVPAFVITSGGVYSGQWISPDVASPAVLVQTNEPVVIENAVVRGPGDLIRADHGYYANLTLRNVHGRGTRPTGAGEVPGRFLAASTYARIVVENSLVEGTAGIYLGHSRDGATVRIVRNRARNVDGRRADGRGGYDGFRYAQFVQLDRGVGLVDSAIAWNVIVNEPYRSRVEDVISLFASSGRDGDPIRVHDNLVHGAYPADASEDASYSGGGIMLGDGGGSHQVAQDNVVVATSNHGIAISGGRDNLIRGNRVVSCGRLPDGEPIASRNVGIYIWNWSGAREFANNRGVGNEVAWNGPTGRNDWWIPDASAWEANVSLLPGALVSCDQEQEEIARWAEKVAAAGIVIGPPSVP